MQWIFVHQPYSSLQPVFRHSMQLKLQTQSQSACVSKSPSLPAGACIIAALRELLLDCYSTHLGWTGENSHLSREQPLDGQARMPTYHVCCPPFLTVCLELALRDEQQQAMTGAPIPLIGTAFCLTGTPLPLLFSPCRTINSHAPSRSMSASGNLHWGQGRLGPVLPCTPPPQRPCPAISGGLGVSVPLTPTSLTPLINGAVPQQLGSHVVMTAVGRQWLSAMRSTSQLPIS